MGARKSKDKSAAATSKNFPDCLSYNGIQICESATYKLVNYGEATTGQGISTLKSEAANDAEGSPLDFFKVHTVPVGNIPPEEMTHFTFKHVGNGRVHILKNNKKLYNSDTLTAPLGVCSAHDTLAPGAKSTLAPFCESAFRSWPGFLIDPPEAPAPIELAFRNLKNGRFNLLIYNNVSPQWKLPSMARRDRQLAGNWLNTLAEGDLPVGPSGTRFKQFGEYIWKLEQV